MSRLVVTAFIVVLAQAVFAIDFLKPKVVSLELTEKDLRPGTYIAPRANSFIGDLIVGELRGDEQFYVGSSEYQNDAGSTVTLQLKLSINSGIINIISAENVGDSRSVVCATADTLGSNESILSIRVPANSHLKLNVIIGAH
ncbi:hypothetical protein WN51_12740 [Melipona quadrifasciata]|uniref:Uncharacterized protein n=1 Tax=Melipona quadrifasciata TaxID=166423 RepID=A0A0M9A0U9_9HYME|nr:hypothetical protein WN51_12740 [Melipona quadrifasciata]